MPILPTDHHLAVALLHPQIAPNTGNIARLCVTAGAELHLVRPMGFVLSDAKLRRSAMDYWPRLRLTVHDDLAAFLAWLGDRRAWLLENAAPQSIWQTRFAPGDVLVLGSETAGASAEVREHFAARLVGIPQAPGERCLNLSTACGIGLYEALRQINA